MSILDNHFTENNPKKTRKHEKLFDVTQGCLLPVTGLDCGLSDCSVQILGDFSTELKGKLASNWELQRSQFTGLDKQKFSA